MGSTTKRTIAVELFSRTYVPLGAIGTDVLVPTHCRGRVDDPALPFLVELDVVVPPDARLGPYATAVRIGARDQATRVDGSLLRKVPVGALVHAVLREAALQITNAGDGTFPAEPLAPDRGEEFGNLYRSDYGREQRRRVGVDLLQRVAEHYRTALRDPIHRTAPTRYVAEQEHVSRATAARYVKRARDEGHLGPALKTRAGEAE